MPEEEKQIKKEVSVFEEDAEKFKPSEKGCGSLLRTKRKIEHIMRLKDVQTSELEENTSVMTLWDFINEETGEHAIIFLLGETQYMYMTEKFDEDFEVLHEGTTEMTLKTKMPTPGE